MTTSRMVRRAGYTLLDSEILESENENGHVTSWVYHGQVMEESRYWTYREIARDGTTFLGLPCSRNTARQGSEPRTGLNKANCAITAATE